MLMKSQLKWADRWFGSAAQSIKLALATGLLGAVAAGSARAEANPREPDLPPDCAKIAAPENNRLVFHVFAVGVQIYRWDGAAWVFVAPEADLFADAKHHAQVGTHFGTPLGPAWETTSGSK